MAFPTVRSDVEAPGEPLWRVVRRLRLELEARMVADPALGDDGAALQVVGLLLQAEGLGRQAHAAASTIETPRNVVPLRAPR